MAETELKVSAISGATLMDLAEENIGYLRKYPDMKLIIIDTFQMVRGSQGEPSYGGDYDVLQKLKRITDCQRVANHHTSGVQQRDIYPESCT